MKPLHINFFILLTLLLVFVMEYFLIDAYYEKMFQYTAFDVKIEIINAALRDFKWYVYQNFIIHVFQWLGILLCLNIGFLYFGINSSFKNILNLSVYSFLATITFQILLVILVHLNNWTFTVGSLKAISSELSLVNFFTIEKTAPWIHLSLSSLNFEQLLILLFLVIGIQKIIKLSIKRAFSIAIRTYGIGILLWFVFAMVMEMNFG